MKEKKEIPVGTPMITWRNWYNGTPRPYHTTTVETFEKFQAYIKENPKADVVTEIYKRFNQS
jgi:hypothetical protein